jgi:hypothetical protein
MSALVRNRFVAFDRADGWIERTRVPWSLSAIDGSASLGISMFPVAEGVVMNLATLLVLEHERRHSHEDHRRFVRDRGASEPASERFFIDETTWTEGTLFGVASTERHQFDFTDLAATLDLPAAFQIWVRTWTVSDGKYVVEATLRAETEGGFDRATAACEPMIRSVRFEGPS